MVSFAYRLLIIAMIGIVLSTAAGALSIYAYPQDSYGWGSKVDPDVVKELSRSGSARVLIVLEDSSVQRMISDMGVRGPGLVKMLMEKAHDSQKSIIASIEASGAVIEDRLWLVNAIVAIVDPDSLRVIASLEGVKSIVLDKVYRLVDPVEKIYDIGSITPQDSVSRRIVQADLLESLGITGRGVRVAVIDTGIQVDHPWLIRNGTSVVTAEYDATGTGVVHVCTYLGIPAEHGTHVAGIIASQDNTHRGVAPGVDIYNVIVFSNITQCEGAFSSWIIRGIEWSLLGPDGRPGTGDEANIISMSLGALAPPWFMYYIASYVTLLTAISRAVDAGATVVIAAGNDGPGGYTINYLCYASGVICVGAVDSRAGSLSRTSVAIFSSRGPVPFDVAAPDVAAPGVGIISSIPINKTAAFSGTSMATPHVSGVAALLKQARPGWSPLDIKRAIVVSASPAPLSDIYESPNPFEQGTGVVMALDALNSPLRLSFPGGALRGQTQTLVIPPGSSGSAALLISNVGNSTVPVNIYLTDLVSYMGSGVLRNSSVSFSQQSISLAPGSSSQVTITVSVPSRTLPGTYAGYVIASTGTYTARLPIVVVVPASLREDVASFSASISTIIGAGPPEWVTFRLYVPQSIDDLVSIASYSEGPLPLAVYAITPSNRFIASVSGLRLQERGEYILILEVTGSYAFPGQAIITLSAPKVLRGLSQIEALASNISSLRSGLEGINASLSQRSQALESRLEILGSAVESIRSAVQTLNNSLISSQQQIDTLGRNLASLAQTVSENTRSILNLTSSFQGFVSDTQKRFSDVEGRLSRAVGDIASLGERFSSFQISVQQMLASQQSSIAEIRGNISSLSQSLGNTTIVSIAGVILAIVGIAIGAIAFSRAGKK
ncbi:MAG TPA: S8 family serine peptidase [Sulfolobales archaeon]|nr:S8 family serine peptidase [Sulfolobales archaeon]